MRDRFPGREKLNIKVSAQPYTFLCSTDNSTKYGFKPPQLSELGQGRWPQIDRGSEIQPRVPHPLWFSKGAGFALLWLSELAPEKSGKRLLNCGFQNRANQSSLPV
jgi:hypothetical protein